MPLNVVNPQDVRQQEQPTINYAANQVASAKLYLARDYREIYLHWTGTLTVVAASNTPANTKRGDEWGALREIRIIRDGETIRRFSGDDLWKLNYFAFQAFPPVTNTLGDGTTANPTFASTLVIPMWMLISDTHTPLDTLVPTSDARELRIEVSFGQHTDVNSAATALTGTLYVYSLESEGQNHDLYQLRIAKQVENISGANSRARVNLENGPRYRGFIITPVNPGTGAESATLITDYALVSGSTVFVRQLWTPAVQIQRLRNRMPSAQTRTAAGVGSTVNLRASSLSNLDAVLFLDLATDGYAIGESINTLVFSDTHFEFNCSGAVNIEIIALMLEPLKRGAVAKAA